MAGRLIIHDRNVAADGALCAALRAAGHRLELADGPEDIRRRLVADAPAAVLLDAGDTADGVGGRMAAAGLRDGTVPVLLTAPDACPAIRLAGLAAGAAEVLPRAACGALPLAVLRRLLRARAAHEELVAQAGMSAPYADPLAHPPAAARIALVALSPLPDLQRGLHLAPGLAVGQLRCVEPAALLGSEESADLVAIAAAPGDTARALALIADLRADARFRRAGILLALQTAAADMRLSDPAADGPPRSAAMALDIGADEVMFGLRQPMEFALRARRMLARKAAADGLRSQISAGLRLAARDPLTGLYNRRVALPRLADMLSEAAAERRPTAVMVVDLDRFKSVNDRYGHAVGDRVLVEVARRLAAHAGPRDLLARIGGEEFLLALPGAAAPAAQVAASRISAALRNRPIALPESGATLRLTASIGLSIGLPGGVVSPDRLLGEADQALLAAKAEGRDQITLARTAA